MSLRKNFGIILVLFLSILAILPLFHQGFFPMHDDTQVARVFEMGKSLRDGMFPVRWVADLGYGYGYPIFNFYAPLAYYFGGFLNLAGLDALLATKTMIGTGVLLSGIFMYLLTREFWGNLGGIVSSLFCVYSIYHAVDIYVRGDVSEFWAYAFIPLVFYGIWKIYKERKWYFVGLGSLGLAGLIISHNLTAMMAAPFILITFLILAFLSIRKREITKFFYLFSVILLGILLSSFYWIPAILEMNYTNVLSQIGGGADFRNHFVCPIQLWSSHWGFGGSTSGCIDGMSFMIGKIYIILAVISLVFITVKILKKKVGKEIFIATMCLFGFSIAAFFTLEVSKPVWEAVPTMSFFQYPWRFLLLTSFFSSILSGFLVWFIQTLRLKFIDYLTVAVLIFVLFFFNQKYFQPHYFVEKKVSDYTSPMTLKWEISKISDEYLPKGFKKPNVANDIPQKQIESENSSVRINTTVEKTQLIEASVNSQKTSQIKMNIAYFPSWNIYLDNKILSSKYNPNGYTILIPPGDHKIQAVFAQTRVELFADFISLSGIGLLFLGIIARRLRLIL